MTRKLDPRDRIVQPFTKEDDKIFTKLYGTMPVKDLIPKMEYPHPLSSMYGRAVTLGIAERKPLWKEPERRLLDKALELGLSYQEVVEASKAHRGVRNMTEAGIAQYLYRVRKGQGEGNE